MRKNRILILVTIALVILSAVILLTRGEGTYKKSDYNFSVKDTALVNRIFIANKNEYQTLLERKDAGHWIVNNQWDASQPIVNLFLETIMNIRPERPLPKAAMDNIIKRLAAVAIKVEIYGTAYRVDFLELKLFPHEKLLKCYYVGDVTQDNMGTYMIMEDSNIPFIVTLPGLRGYVASRYQVLQNDWRSHAILNLAVNEIESVRLENIANADESYVINTSVPNGKFSITTLDMNSLPYVVDSLKVYNFLNSFKRINFEAFMNEELGKEAIDSIRKTSPIYVMDVKQKNGKSSRIVIYQIVNQDIIDFGTNEDAIDQDRCYAYLEDGELVLIQYFVFDKVLRPRSYFYQQIPQKPR